MGVKETDNRTDEGCTTLRSGNHSNESGAMQGKRTVIKGGFWNRYENMRTGVDGTHGLTPLTVPPTVSRVFKAGLLVIERQRKDRTLNNSRTLYPHLYSRWLCISQPWVAWRINNGLCHTVIYIYNILSYNFILFFAQHFNEIWKRILHITESWTIHRKGQKQVGSPGWLQ